MFFGHAHRYRRDVLDGLHFVSQPATAYTFAPGEPLGWLDAEVTPDRVTLTLCELPLSPTNRDGGPGHPEADQRFTLRFR